MARNRRSTFEGMIEVASYLPWWLASILAVLSYFLFHYFSFLIIPPATGLEQFSSIIWKQALKSFSMIFQFIFPIVFVFGALISAVKQYKRRSIFERQTSLDSIKDLSWQSFELLISEAFRKKGYQVTETQDGPDGGVDIILKKEDRTFFVQCKHWKKQKVGVKEVRELNGVVSARNVYSGILVTSGKFTTDAIDFAKTSGIELIDGKELFKLIPKIGSNTQYQEYNNAAPSCPRCGDIMIKRTAKKGTNIGDRFWGCSAFPKCKGIVNI